MVFDPAVGQQLAIDGESYTFTSHPASPAMPYGQQGRAATVYQLASASCRHALKVFKPAFRFPGLVSLDDRVAPYAELPGLEVCRRAVLSGRRHEPLLRAHPDLLYSVLMPWIEGPTWMQVMLEKRELPAAESLMLTRGLVECLAAMEEHRLAHCDLSGPNVLLPCLIPSVQLGFQPAVSLVDVEQMYGPGLDRPEALPGGSPGYAHPTAGAGEWDARADRFAGAVLIAEMLGWCDDRVKQAAWGESYFEPGEVGSDCERYRLLASALSERWGQSVSSLFERAWSARDVSECPTFGEWLVGIPQRSREGEADQGTVAGQVSRLLLHAARLEVAGDLEKAATAYQQLLQQISVGDSLREEVELILMRLHGAMDREKELGQRAIEAKGHEGARRWREAATLYEGLLAEKAGSPGELAAWEDGLKRCRQEAELAELFDAALKLRGQRESRAARELLVEVVRRRPDYEGGGRRAAALLAEVGGDEPHPSRSRWVLTIAGIGLVVLLLVAGTLSQAQFGAASQSAAATAQAVDAAMASAVAAASGISLSADVIATAAAQATAARSTAEAVADATRSAATAEADAKATAAARVWVTASATPSKATTITPTPSTLAPPTRTSAAPSAPVSPQSPPAAEATPVVLAPALSLGQAWRNQGLSLTLQGISGTRSPSGEWLVEADFVTVNESARDSSIRLPASSVYVELSTGTKYPARFFRTPGGKFTNQLTVDYLQAYREAPQFFGVLFAWQWNDFQKALSEQAVKYYTVVVNDFHALIPQARWRISIQR